MDISSMLIGKSEQLDNIDLLSGPRDFTIAAVSKGPDDQPLNITLAEYPRPWRPGLTMRRMLAAMWGPEADDYIGRKVRLYRDPDVRFGNDKTGGTRISHASHLDRRITVSLPTSKGKFGAFTVEPLAESAVTKPARTPPPAPVDAWERDTDATPEPLSDHTRRQMFAELTKHGITDPATQRAGMGKILGREIKSRADLSEDDGRAIVLDLMGRPVHAAPDHAEDGAP